MRIATRYSHMNGEEDLLAYHPGLWREVQAVIERVDAEACKARKSEEFRTKNPILYSPVDMNLAFKTEFGSVGWRKKRNTFWVTDDEKILRSVYAIHHQDQRAVIEAAGRSPIMSYNQIDLVKNKVAVEVQFDKYYFVAHDIFVKHLNFYIADIIEVAIEILPMKTLAQQISSDTPYYERELHNIIHQGPGVPDFPIVLIGLVP